MLAAVGVWAVVWLGQTRADPLASIPRPADDRPFLGLPVSAWYERAFVPPHLLAAAGPAAADADRGGDEVVADPWRVLGFSEEPTGRSTRREWRTDWGEYTSKLVATDDGPEARGTVRWKSQESVKVPVTDSVFVFGQVGTDSQLDRRRIRVTGKTGVGWRWSPLPKSEVQVRGGPVVNAADPSQPLEPEERSQLALELSAKCPLWGPLAVEYTGSALPALTPTERDRVDQDVRVALPLGGRGSLHVGARVWWEGRPVPVPLAERTELYMGVKQTW